MLVTFSKATSILFHSVVSQPINFIKFVNNLFKGCLCCFFRVRTAFKKKNSLTFIEFSRFFPDQNDKKVPFSPDLAGFPRFFPEPGNIEKMNN